uniref:Uncharacterized protein n=1 Tax=Calidris pygmaea TaxID=425635 RepID=A0A8C3K517_9CHAR
MEMMDLNKDKRTRKRKRPCRDDPITWGKLKQLQQHASTMMATVGAPPTPVKTFLAYLAIISSNSQAGKPPGGVCIERCG